MDNDITYDEDTITIYGTIYSRELFKEFGCSFPDMVGQVLRVDKKEDGIITLTRLPERERPKFCKTCKSWTPFNEKYPGHGYMKEDPVCDGGICESDKLTEPTEQNAHMANTLTYAYDEGGSFWTGPEFGCVHWEER